MTMGVETVNKGAEVLDQPATQSSASTAKMLRVELEPEIEATLNAVCSENMGPVINLKKVLERLLSDPDNRVLQKMRRDVLLRFLHNEEALLKLTPVLEFVGFKLSADGSIYEYTPPPNTLYGASKSDLNDNSKSDTAELESKMHALNLNDETNRAENQKNVEQLFKDSGILGNPTAGATQLEPRDPDDPLLKMEIADNLFRGVDVDMNKELEGSDTTEDAAGGDATKEGTTAESEDAIMKEVRGINGSTDPDTIPSKFNNLKQIVNWIQLKEGRAAESFTFAEVIHFVQNQMILPGIQVVEEPTERVEPSTSQMKRPPKPWEK